MLTLSVENDGLVMEFRAKAAEGFAVQSLEYCRCGNRALRMNDNEFNFSPASRNAMGSGATLYKRPCDSSMDSCFTPPPFLMVTGNRGGKVVYSLLDMPDSYVFRMSDKFGVLAEAPGGAKAVEAGGEYVAPRMMLSFPDDEWDAQERYRRALLDRGLISPVRIEDKNIPDWWRRFAVCSYGDQMAQQPYNVLTADDWASPDYNTEWLRRWLDEAERRLGQKDFTLVFDAFWQCERSQDPVPDPARFPDLRAFIDECHLRGHKVLLWVAPFCSDRPQRLTAIEQGGQKTSGETREYTGQTLAGRFGVVSCDRSGEPFIDWTADGIEDYLAEYCRLLFSGEPDCLDADGLKIKLQHSKAPQKETVQPPKKGAAPFPQGNTSLCASAVGGRRFAG